MNVISGLTLSTAIKPMALNVRSRPPQSFHDAAYKAEGRNDLMWAFKEFLDDTLVLPPIDWTANPDVLDVHELQMRSREIQERKKEKLAALEKRRDGKEVGDVCTQAWCFAH